jgi:hypothetical protein
MDIIGILINLLIIVGILGLVWWALSQIPLPPVGRIIVNIVLAIIGIIFLASMLTGHYHGIVLAR